MDTRLLMDLLRIESDFVNRRCAMTRVTDDHRSANTKTAIGRSINRPSLYTGESHLVPLEWPFAMLLNDIGRYKALIVE